MIFLKIYILQDGLIISFFAKGPWLMGGIGIAPILMPDLLIDVRLKSTPGTFISYVDRSPTDNFQKMVSKMVISSKGIEGSSHIIVQRSEESIILEYLTGMHNEEPFRVLNTIAIKNTDPSFQLISDLRFKMGENILQIPESDTDMSIIDLLLAQYDNLEKNVQKELPPKVEELDSDDEETTDKDEKKIKNEAKRQAREQERQANLQYERTQRENRIRELEEEALQKIILEIERKEILEAQVREEQEAVRQKVSASQNSPLSSKKGKKNVVPQSVVKSTEPIESEDNRKERIRSEASKILAGKRMKMNAMVSCLNKLFKLMPEARDRLLRQRGSHMVADATASSNPTTFIIPHGGDGTISVLRANNFIESFFGLFRVQSKN